MTFGIRAIGSPAAEEMVDYDDPEATIAEQLQQNTRSLTACIDSLNKWEDETTRRFDEVMDMLRGLSNDIRTMISPSEYESEFPMRTLYPDCTIGDVYQVEEQQLEASLSTTSFKVTVKGQVTEDPTSAITTENPIVEVLQNNERMEQEENDGCIFGKFALHNEAPKVSDEMPSRTLIEFQGADTHGSGDDESQVILKSNERNLKTLEPWSDSEIQNAQNEGDSVGKAKKDEHGEEEKLKDMEIISPMASQVIETPTLYDPIAYLYDQINQRSFLAKFELCLQCEDSLPSFSYSILNLSSDVDKSNWVSGLLSDIFKPSKRVMIGFEKWHKEGNNLKPFNFSYVYNYSIDEIGCRLFDPGGISSPQMDCDVLKIDNELVGLGIAKSKNNRGKFIAVIEMTVNKNNVWKVLENALTYEEDLIGVNGYFEYEVPGDAKLDCLLVFHFVVIVVYWRIRSRGLECIWKGILLQVQVQIATMLPTFLNKALQRVEFVEWVNKVGKEWTELALLDWFENYLQATIVYRLKIIATTYCWIGKLHAEVVIIWAFGCIHLVNVVNAIDLLLPIIDGLTWEENESHILCFITPTSFIQHELLIESLYGVFSVRLLSANINAATLSVLFPRVHHPSQSFYTASAESLQPKQLKISNIKTLYSNCNAQISNSSLATLVNWFSAWVCSFNFLMSWSSSIFSKELQRKYMSCWSELYSSTWNAFAWSKLVLKICGPNMSIAGNNRYLVYSKNGKGFTKFWSVAEAITNEERILSSKAVFVMATTLENLMWDPGLCAIYSYILEDNDVLKRKGIGVRLTLKQDKWSNGATAHHNEHMEFDDYFFNIDVENFVWDPGLV